MKKQILILTFFVAAILAGTNAFGQTYDTELGADLTDCLTPTTLTCWDSVSALHPSAGVEYTYTITSEDTDGANNTEQVHWFVVDNADLGANGLIALQNNMAHIAAAVDPADGTESLLPLATGMNLVYNVPTQTSDAITLSWNYFDGQNQVVLLVAYVVDAVNCTDNIEVYRIFPEFNFTLDIAAIDQDDPQNYVTDTAAPPTECVSPIQSAIYAAAGSGSDDNGVAPSLLTVDYGENYVYFIVNAANFVGAWTPTFYIDYDGTGGSAVITDAAYTYFGAENSATATWTNIPVAPGGATAAPVIAGGGTDGVADNLASDLIPIGAAGECIIVRVHLDYGTLYENVTQTMVTVAVDGVMMTASDGTYGAVNSALADYGPDTSGDLVCDQNAQDDISYFDLTPRPDVNESAPTPFEDKTGRDQ